MTKSKDPIDENRVAAKKFHRMGYRKISNKYCLVARIDRPDWVEFLAEQHPDRNEGFEWALGLGRAAAGSFYLAVHSKDVIEVPREVYRFMHRCDDHHATYIELKEKETKKNPLMETFIDRMDDEYDELCDRLDKLDEFISDSDVYVMLSGDEKHDLQEQLKAMERYRIVLSRRIRRLRDF